MDPLEEERVSRPLTARPYLFIVTEPKAEVVEVVPEQDQEAIHILQLQVVKVQIPVHKDT